MRTLQHPSGIWVLDETFVLWYPSVTKTLAKRGAKTVKAVTPNEKLASTALLVGRVHMTWKKVKGSWIPNIVHASNDPPFLIFKGVTGATIDSGLDAAGEHATCTPSAWINAEVFKKWINIRFPVRPKEKARMDCPRCFQGTHRRVGGGDAEGERLTRATKLSEFFPSAQPRNVVTELQFEDDGEDSVVELNRAESSDDDCLRPGEDVDVFLPDPDVVEFTWADMHRAEEGVVDEPPTLEAAEPSESEEDREIRRATAIFEAELASLHLNPDEVNEVDGVCDSDYEEGEEVESCDEESYVEESEEEDEFDE